VVDELHQGRKLKGKLGGLDRFGCQKIKWYFKPWHKENKTNQNKGNDQTSES